MIGCDCAEAYSRLSPGYYTGTGGILSGKKGTKAVTGVEHFQVHHCTLFKGCILLPQMYILVPKGSKLVPKGCILVPSERLVPFFLKVY